MKRIVLSICMLMMAATSVFAATRGKALLIGVEGYEKVPELEYVGNDVRRLAETLSDRCGFEVQLVIDTDVDEKVRRIGPTTHRDVLMKTIKEWIDGMNQTDTAVLYFSGHGFVGQDDKLYLASLNCDARNPVPGGVPVAWLREQLSRCPARCKVLFLDACHAGTSKGVGATAKAIEVEMRKLPDVVTLASCGGNQKSHLWPGKTQSLFTYWLGEAIKGHADTDADADGRITMDELTKYVQRNVSRTAEKLGYQQQNPTTLGGDKARKKLQLAPKPILLERLIADMAEKIDSRMRQKKLSVIGIPEFASGELGNTLGIAYGTLLAYIANQLTDRLVAMADGDYAVIGGKALHKELSRRGIDVTNLETATISDLRVGGIGVDVLAIGRVRGRKGVAFRLGCKLKKPGSPAQIGSANGVCFLTDSERSQFGQSANMLNMPPPPPGASVEAVMAQRVRWVDQQSQKPHPILNPSFPFAVEIHVKGPDGKFTKRDGEAKGNDYYVTLRRGEIYRIYIVNRVTHGTFLRLLVDGLNTLPEKKNTREKGVVVEPVESEGELTMAPRVNLAMARAWYLDPAEQDSKGKVKPARYCIRGFYKKTGNDDAYREFVVTDAPESAASRKGYTEQIGLITAALYSPTSPKAIGTEFGKEYKQHLKYYKGNKVPGDLIGVLHVRYDEP